MNGRSRGGPGDRSTGLWRLVAGFGVWVSAPIWIYAIKGVGCAMGWEAQRPALAAALAAHLAVLGWLALRMRGDGLLGSVGVWCVRAALALSVCH